MSEPLRCSHSLGGAGSYPVPGSQYLWGCGVPSPMVKTSNLSAASSHHLCANSPDTVLVNRSRRSAPRDTATGGSIKPSATSIHFNFGIHSLSRRSTYTSCRPSPEAVAGSRAVALDAGGIGCAKRLEDAANGRD